MKTSAKVTARLTALGLAAALALTACGGGAESASSGGTDGKFAKDSDTLVMGMVPDEGQATSTYQPLADYVAKVTGKKVEVKQSTNYAALIEASIAGQVDVVSFSAFTYLQAKSKGAALTPVGATITEKVVASQDITRPRLCRAAPALKTWPVSRAKKSVLSAKAPPLATFSRSTCSKKPGLIPKPISLR